MTPRRMLLRELNSITTVFPYKTFSCKLSSRRRSSGCSTETGHIVSTFEGGLNIQPPLDGSGKTTATAPESMAMPSGEMVFGLFTNTMKVRWKGTTTLSSPLEVYILNLLHVLQVLVHEHAEKGPKLL